jgi:protein-L-isoaspartate(D-aspartate) O-methyltransferase
MAKRIATVLLLVSGLIFGGWPETGTNARAAAAENEEGQFRRLRAAMVRTQISDPPDYRNPVRDRRVLGAMLTVPRHLFVSRQDVSRAYGDHPLPIGHGQTISQPYIVALMTELLDVQAHHRVLEVGTGSGYQAAVLSRLASSVYSVEIVQALGSQASERLAQLGYKNVHPSIADGYYGWKEHAPFDRIIVTCAATLVPPPLIKQLRPGGRICIPVGGQYTVQQLVLVDKSEEGSIKMRKMLPVRFVPLTRSLR